MEGTSGISPSEPPPGRGRSAGTSWTSSAWVEVHLGAKPGDPYLEDSRGSTWKPGEPGEPGEAEGAEEPGVNRRSRWRRERRGSGSMVE